MKKMTSTPVAKTYRLLREVAPLSFMLASHHNKRTPLLYFDEEKGINRPLRYARNQKSPFEDEQDGNAIMEPIVFEDGFLRVERGNQVLQKFLYYHPHNGSIFEELNPAKDAAGGTGTVTYNWNGFDPTQLYAGVFNYIATDANGCTYEDSVLIIQPDSLIILPTVNNISCIVF